MVQDGKLFSFHNRLQSQRIVIAVLFNWEAIGPQQAFFFFLGLFAYSSLSFHLILNDQTNLFYKTNTHN